MLGGIFAYSLPALAWFVLIAVVWLALALSSGERRVDWSALREAVWRRRLALGVAAGALAAIAFVSAGRVGGFVDRIGDVSASTGRLSSPVFPGEALAIWPEGDFRVVRGEVDGAIVATLLGAIAVVAGAVILWRRRSFALLAALGASVAIYVGARVFSSIYVEAKALAVMAPLVVVVALGGLLATAAGWSRPSAAGAGRRLRDRRRGLDVPRPARDAGWLRGPGASSSSSSPRRSTGESLVFLGVDRFAAYWLRETLIRSPGGYVPPEVGAREGKVWQQGRALDLDTLSPDRLDEFDYAITTAAAYQSSPPANMRELARTDSYVLWERTARTPRSQVLDEGGAPGVVVEKSSASQSRLRASPVATGRRTGAPRCCQSRSSVVPGPGAARCRSTPPAPRSRRSSWPRGAGSSRSSTTARST